MTGMNKEAFWEITFSRGFDARMHTHFWLLYCDLNKKQKKKLSLALQELPIVRKQMNVYSFEAARVGR